MSIRKAETTWFGTLKDGNGKMKAESGAFEVPFTWSTRFGDEAGTNPEELVGAAHAGCFTMSLSARLTNKGFVPEKLHTVAHVHFGRDDAGPLIQKIELVTTAHVPGVSQEDFDWAVADAKEKCPISRALAAVAEITVNATLIR